jgi:hypothetical protein
LPLLHIKKKVYHKKTKARNPNQMTSAQKSQQMGEPKVYKAMSGLLFQIHLKTGRVKAKVMKLQSMKAISRLLVQKRMLVK